MEKMNVYIVPIRNWPEDWITRWYLENGSGQIIARVSFATLAEAQDYAKKKGWNLPNEP